jgi:hypothetical protein
MRPSRRSHALVIVKARVRLRSISATCIFNVILDYLTLKQEGGRKFEFHQKLIGTTHLLKHVTCMINLKNMDIETDRSMVIKRQGNIIYSTHSDKFETKVQISLSNSDSDVRVLRVYASEKG